jgi:hypothetical protein
MSKIRLKRGLLKPLRYEHGTEKPASVYDFTGWDCCKMRFLLIVDYYVGYIRGQRVYGRWGDR